MPRYEPVADFTVDLKRQRIVFEALNEAIDLLKIPRPAVVWCQESKTGKEHPIAYGWVTIHPDLTADEINIVKTVPLDKLRALVFHECRHIWQDVTHRFSNTAADELDAESFTYRMTGHVSL